MVRTQQKKDFLALIRSQFSADFLSEDPQDLETYGRDWTRVYTPAPCAIAFPRTTEEVSRLLSLCSAHRVAVVPSGGRTGLAGGAVAARGELVVSLARMNRIDAVDPLAQTLRAQAGAVTQKVHEHCAPHGLTWPVDFASKGSSHIGGNIATNAGGVKVIHYGLTRQWVLGLQVVLMNGEVLELNGALEKNNTGLDLRQLFIGTEGTLGIITEATLKLARLPGDLDVFFFSVTDTSAVLKLFLHTRRAPFALMAYECLTQNCLDAVLQARGAKSPLAKPGGCYVLVEVERPTTSDGQAVLEQWLASLFEEGLVLDGTLAQSPREGRELWTLREGIAESLYARGLLHKNDISVPVSQLEPFIAEMNTYFEQMHSGLPLYVFGHIGDGNLHLNAIKPEGMDKSQFLSQCHESDKGLFALVRKYQGSISAEHGIGLLKKGDLHFSRTSEEMTILRAVKMALDPLGLLNPGKIFNS